MPSHANCCVPGCTNQKNHCKRGLFPNEDGVFVKRRLCGSKEKAGCRNTSPICTGLSFHRLPANKHLRKDWIAKIRRDNTPMGENTYVCGVHFEGGRRRDVDSLPVIFPWSTQTRKRKTFTSMAAAAIPNPDICQGTEEISDDCTDQNATSAKEESDCAENMDVELSVSPPDSPTASCFSSNKDPGDVELLREHVDFLLKEYLKVSRELTEEKARAVSLEHKLQKAEEEVKRLQESVSELSLSYSKLKEKPDVLKFYTGLESEAIDFLFAVVGDSSREACRHTVKDTSHFHGLQKQGRKRALKPEDELLLTLCKLRHDFPQADLALRFGVHQSTVSRIFSCWTETIEACFDEFPLWPDKEVIQQHMPAVFQVWYYFF